ncbi:MAG TPA: DUF262 domain-containing HNH endonuclease family protein [Ignavibacteriaceae bacterium]|nr:DUF262 domain-containing HNH endonuclease family protein [Ignavibacteriaceae bacterium]
MKEGIHSLYDFFNSNRIYRIPSYQRNYAWTKEKQLKDFWEDIFYLDDSKKYFLGTILVRLDGIVKDDSGFNEFERWEIIDGQQRTITASIFIKVAIQILKTKIAENGFDEKYKDRFETDLIERENIYLKKYELEKLRPLGEDAIFYQNYIIKYEDYPDETITPSQRRIKEARKYFEEKLEQLDISGINSMLKKIDNSRVVIYPVEKRDEAVLIFETVNDRGKPLSDLEKVKSFLMYTIYLSSEDAYKLKENIEALQKNRRKLNKALEQINKTEKSLKEVEEIYGRIFRCLESLEKNKIKLDEDSILRYHYVLWDKEIRGDYDESFNYLVNIKNYFRNLVINNRNEVITKVIDYSKGLEKVFFALKELFVDLYESQDKKDLAEKLNKITALSWLGNFYPLLISSWLRFYNKKDILINIFDCLEKYIFRVYLIGNRRSNAGVNTIYRIAYQLYMKEIAFSELINEIINLSDTYVDDEDFELFIKHKNFYSNYASKEIRYILYHYELHLRNTLGEPIDLSLLNILSEKFSVEHILAEELDIKDRPKELRKQKIWEEKLNTIGNLTLASASWNSSMGKKKFILKRDGDRKTKAKSDYPCYRDSIFKCQQELVKFNDFSLNQMNDRENKLYSFIVNNWEFKSY